jgi:hypothetical protein
VFGGCAWLVMVMIGGRGRNEREEWVWVGESKMRRAATLEDRVVHGALEEHLARLYVAGDFLSFPCFGIERYERMSTETGARPRGLCRNGLKRVHQRQVSNLKARGPRKLSRRVPLQICYHIYDLHL